VLADQLHGLIRLVLADIANGSGTEEDASAFVPGATERLDRDH
jgi:hypothetical protein